MPALPASLLSRTWRELRRRRVVRAGGTYALIAWVVLQIGEVTFEPLGIPQRVMTWTVLGALLGFPVVLVLAWFFDVGPGGVARDRRSAAGAGRVFAVFIVLLTVLAVGGWLTTLYGDEAPAAAASTAPANSIAVLPFDDLSASKDQGYLADGIAEALLDQLARNPSLKVAARTSSFALRGRAEDVREIGRLLNVRWVLEGSLRKAEGRLRITAQLIDADSGFHTWSETYEREDKDLFALQDDVSAAIAEQLAQRVRGVSQAPTEAVAPGETQDAQAHELYLKGRQAWRLRTPAGLAEAERLFLQATERDPHFARAWAGLADAYLLQVDYGLRPLADTVPQAAAAAERAVTLAPRLGEAWASLGLLRVMVGQYAAARRSLEEAIRLDPHYEMAPMWLSGALGAEGKLDEQLRVLREAQELNPLEPVINFNLAQTLERVGERDAARAVLERLLAVTPDHPMLLRGLAQLERGSGRLQSALEHARNAYRQAPDTPAVAETLVKVLLRLEAFDAAQAIAEGMPARAEAKSGLLQEIALRRGDARLLPEFAARLRALGAQATLAPSECEALGLGAWVAIAAGNEAQAMQWLAPCAGAPERLAENVARLEPASLLAALLERSGRRAEAEVWWTALEDVARPWLDQIRNTPDGHYGAALIAIRRGDRQSAEQALEAAWQSGYRDRWQLAHDPRLADLIESPALQALRTRIADELADVRRRTGLTQESSP